MKLTYAGSSHLGKLLARRMQEIAPLSSPRYDDRLGIYTPVATSPYLLVTLSVDQLAGKIVAPDEMQNTGLTGP